VPEPIRVTYVTSSPYKREELRILVDQGVLRDGGAVGDRFEFDLRGMAIQEALEPSLERLAMAEAQDAYRRLRVPCIVEHAGLIFDDYGDFDYPGGLTKPMWNTLGDRFLEETRSRGRRARACAAVGYCDGMSLQVFVGETRGKLSHEPRGGREFYWDTVFIPDCDEGGVDELTYAEIIETAGYGLPYKVLTLSQSAKAIRSFLEHRLENPPKLWRT
jgi:XTP/dITP diphosphohydrolase